MIYSLYIFIYYIIIGREEKNRQIKEEFIGEYGKGIENRKKKESWSNIK